MHFVKRRPRQKKCHHSEVVCVRYVGEYAFDSRSHLEVVVPNADVGGSMMTYPRLIPSITAFQNGSYSMCQLDVYG